MLHIPFLLAIVSTYLSPASVGGSVPAKAQPTPPAVVAPSAKPKCSPTRLKAAYFRVGETKPLFTFEGDACTGGPEQSLVSRNPDGEITMHLSLVETAGGLAVLCGIEEESDKSGVLTWRPFLQIRNGEGNASLQLSNLERRLQVSVR